MFLPLQEGVAPGDLGPAARVVIEERLVAPPQEIAKIYEKSQKI